MLFENGATPTVTYLWGNGLVRRGSEYPMTDGLGTTKLVTNLGAATTETQNMDAFGRGVGSTGSTASPYVYHGSEGYRADGDGPAGLDPYQQVGARYYDQLSGSFLTRDTDLSQSPYAYCDGDPVNCTDPSGHDVSDDAKYGAGDNDKNAGIAIVVGAVLLGITLLATGVVITPLIVVGIAALEITGAVMAIDGLSQQDEAENHKASAGDANDSSTINREIAGEIAAGAGDAWSFSMPIWRDWNRKTGGWIGDPYTGDPHGPVQQNPYQH